MFIVKCCWLWAITHSTVLQQFAHDFRIRRMYRALQAFQEKIEKQANGLGSGVSGLHKRGCHCKKSHCKKKYCECFQV